MTELTSKPSLKLLKSHFLLMSSFSRCLPQPTFWQTITNTNRSKWTTLALMFSLRNHSKSLATFFHWTTLKSFNLIKQFKKANKVSWQYQRLNLRKKDIRQWELLCLALKNNLCNTVSKLLGIKYQGLKLKMIQVGRKSTTSQMTNLYLRVCGFHISIFLFLLLSTLSCLKTFL